MNESGTWFCCYLWIETEVDTKIQINTIVKPVEFGFKPYLPNAFG